MVYETFYQIWDSFILFLPNLLGAVVLLLTGWLISWGVGRILKKLLIKLRIDQYVSRGRKPVFRLSGIFSTIVFWIIFLIFIQATVDVMGIETLVNIFGSILSFLPGLFGAVVFIVVSYMIAEYVRRKIEDSDISYSNILGKVFFFLIVYVGIAMALPLIKIDATLINAILLVTLGSFGLGLALAIGLGFKDSVADLAKRHIIKKKKK